MGWSVAVVSRAFEPMRRGCSCGQIQRLRHEALEIVRILGDLGVATPTNLQPEIRDAEDIQAEPRS
jgi:hypothetical protein